MPLKTLVLFVALSSALMAQPLGVGVKLGVPATDAFDVFPLPSFSPFDAEQRPFVFGPYVELRLPARLAIELDALYRSFEFRNATINESADSWEFPLLLKYRFSSGFIRPYAEGGASFRRLSDIGFTTLQNRSNYGVVLGGGLEFNVLLFKIAPEIRYTGWGKREFDEPLLQTNRNQLTVLFSLGF
jgi:hypothetical protein